MSDTPNRLDAGARGGLAGQAVVAAALTAMVAVYSAAPLVCSPAMAVLGAAALVTALRVARRRRRFFSAVQWTLLGGLLLAAWLLLRAAPSDELLRYWREDPTRQRNALLVAAALVGVGIVSFTMLRRRDNDGRSS